MHLGSNPQITHFYSPALTSLSARDFITDLNDWVMFAGRHVERDLVRPIEEVKEAVDSLLSNGQRIAYVTGGFEGTIAHLQLIGQFFNPIVLGLEPDEYIIRKGRQPLRTLEQRIDFWSKVLPEGSVIFVVPEYTEDSSYDTLAKEIGVFMRPNVYHIGCGDDREDVKAARMKRAFDGHYLEISFGEKLHASNYVAI